MGGTPGLLPGLVLADSDRGRAEPEGCRQSVHVGGAGAGPDLVAGSTFLPEHRGVDARSKGGARLTTHVMSDSVNEIPRLGARWKGLEPHS